MNIQNIFIIFCVFAAIFIVAHHIRHQWRKGLYFANKKLKDNRNHEE